MDPIRQLLIDLLGVTEQEATELSLEEAEARLVAAGEEIDTENATDDDVERLTALADAARQVREAHAAEEAAAEERRERAAEAAAQLRGEVTDEQEEGEEAADGTPPAEGEPAEAAPEGEPEAAPAEPAAEPAPAEVPAPEATAPAAAEVTAQVPEPVAAAAVPAAPRITRARTTPVRRRTPEVAAPQSERLKRGNVTITAAADLPGTVSGSELEFADIGPAMARRWETLEGANGVDGNVPVARLNADYPAERQLNWSDPPELTEEKIEAVCGKKALIAAGGFCAPTTPLYDLVTVSVADRPVRDGLPSFQANRGGIRYVPPPLLTDVANSVSTWSAATDASPGGSTKPCLTVTCGEVTEKLLDAIPFCMQFGNFQARAFPEQVDRYMQLGIAFQARYAERKILTAIGTGSTNVSTNKILGATRDFLADVDRVAAQYRNRHRMGPESYLRVIIPDWLDDMIRADLARTLSNTLDTLRVADAIIDSFYAARNINVTRALEGETGQDYGVQAAGGVNPWVKNVVWYLFHEGAWVFLDGGILDIGLVRDSTLNSKNNFQMFSETFEQVAFRGVESLRVTSTLCPDGGVAATIDSTGLCTSGS